MNSKDVYLEYRCPRWNDYPTIELYMDQVLNILEDSLAIFTKSEKLITSSMINNYVKQKIVKPPIKKKYDRVHLAYLYVVCVLKSFMPISQICEGMAFAMKKYTIPQVYDMFCDELEMALHSAFTQNEKLYDDNLEDCEENSLIRAVTVAFANLTYAQYLIADNSPSEK